MDTLGTITGVLLGIVLLATIMFIFSAMILTLFYGMGFAVGTIMNFFIGGPVVGSLTFVEFTSLLFMSAGAFGTSKKTVSFVSDKENQEAVKTKFQNIRGK